MMNDAYTYIGFVFMCILLLLLFTNIDCEKRFCERKKYIISAKVISKQNCFYLISVMSYWELCWPQIIFIHICVTNWPIVIIYVKWQAHHHHPIDKKQTYAKHAHRIFKFLIKVRGKSSINQMASVLTPHSHVVDDCTTMWTFDSTNDSRIYHLCSGWGSVFVLCRPSCLTRWFDNRKHFIIWLDNFEWYVRASNFLALFHTYTGLTLFRQ